MGDLHEDENNDPLAFAIAMHYDAIMIKSNQKMQNAQMIANDQMRSKMRNIRKIRASDKNAQSISYHRAMRIARNSLKITHTAPTAQSQSTAEMIANDNARSNRSQYSNALMMLKIAPID